MSAMPLDLPGHAPRRATGEICCSIRVRDLSKSYSTREGKLLLVLDGISIDVAPGQTHVILGPSGGGKSTLLQILAGLASFDDGEITIDGVDLRRFAKWRTIGYAFQDDRLLPWRTVLRNVSLALEFPGISREEQLTRSRRILEIVGLSQFEGAYPHELSGGMRSRAALARSLVTEPRILLMDEPFARLDAQTRANLQDEFIRLRRLFEMTVVLVTHDQEEALILGDHITVFTHRPARVADSFPVATSVKRDPTTPEGAAIVKRLRAALRASV